MGIGGEDGVWEGKELIREGKGKDGEEGEEGRR
jgi:hypothetical protein